MPLAAPCRPDAQEHVRVCFVADQPRNEVAHRWLLDVGGCARPWSGSVAVGGPAGGGRTGWGLALSSARRLSSGRGRCCPGARSPRCSSSWRLAVIDERGSSWRLTGSSSGAVGGGRVCRSLSAQVMRRVMPVPPGQLRDNARNVQEGAKWLRLLLQRPQVLDRARLFRGCARVRARWTWPGASRALRARCLSRGARQRVGRR